MMTFVRAVAFTAMLSSGLTACGGTSGGDCQLVGLPAHLTGTPIPAQPIPSGAGVSGTFTVALSVSLDNGGNVTGASVTTSSGNIAIDQAAIAVARAASYRSAENACGSSFQNNVALSITYS